MRKGTRTTRVLLTFVGTNDAGKLTGDTDGAILTVFRERKFDEVHLLWNPSKTRQPDFKTIADHVQDEILRRGYCDSVKLHRLDCKNVTDHNEIYPKLLALCQSPNPNPNRKFTAAVASGTPAMQVCWILMAESGDFPLELIRSNEPRFGKPYVSQIKLGTGLPRILRLEEENKQLQDERTELIPALEINIQKGEVTVAGIAIPLSPIEFAYYRYFAERVLAGKDSERVSGINMPAAFLRKIVQFHGESFPDAELFRQPLERMLRDGKELSASTFRANVAKANRRIREALRNPSWAKLFEIAIYGKRHSKTFEPKGHFDRFYHVRISSNVYFLLHCILGSCTREH